MTNITRFSPRTSLQNEVNRLFDEFFPTRVGEEGESDRFSKGLWRPRVDLSETDDEYVVSMDLPGLSKDDVNVTLEGNTLNISGERKVQHEAQEGSYRRMERSYGRFYRSFTLGDNVDPNEIHAEHENGVLTVHIPKTETSKPRKVEIS